MRRSAVTLAAASVAAVAGWLARGALAVEGPGPHSPRIGLLPPWWQLAALLAVAIFLALSGRLSRDRALPLFTCTFLLLPWLPFAVLPAFLIWTGPVAVLVLAATGAAVLAAAPLPDVLRFARLFSNPARAPIVAAIVAATLYATAAWRLAPRLPGGDEPHYLIITQSLIDDGDLQIENNHARGDYRAYFPGELRPDYLRRGVNGQIYSVHAPGLSVLVAPAFAVAGYPGAIAFLVLLSAAATAGVWKIGYEITGQSGAAWFGWAAVSLTAPFFFHAFMIYPDGAAAAIVVTGVLAIVGHVDRTAWRWLAHGAALACLPWLHTRYALLAAVLGAALLIRIAREPRPVRAAAAFLVAPLLSAACWLGFFYVLYGRLNPSAPYGNYTQTDIAFIGTGLPGLLFDQQFGLMANAPIYAFAVPGLWLLARRRPAGTPGATEVEKVDRGRRPDSTKVQTGRSLWLAVMIPAVVVPYLLLAGAYRMWWGGSSAPARFATPIVLALAVPLAALWSSTRSRATKTMALAALGASLAITAILGFGDSGSLLFNVRDGTARWLKWVSPLASLSVGMPSFFRTSPGDALLHAVIWMGIIVAAWAVLRLAEARGATRSALVLSAPVLLAVAAMSATTVVWAITEAVPISVASAQSVLLAKYDPAARPFGVRIERMARIAAAAVPLRLEIPSAEVAESPRRPAGTPGATTRRQLFSTPWLPAGRYQIQVGAWRTGVLSIQVGRAPRAVHLIDLSALPLLTAPTVTLPVDVSALTVTGDDAANAGVQGITLRPLMVEPRAARIAPTTARQSARYGKSAVYGMDSRASLERTGLWTMGGTDTAVVIQPDGDIDFVRLFVRNAPVANRLIVESDGWRRQLTLAPGEQQTLDVPVKRDAARRGAVLVKLTTASGFRPRDVTPRSGDSRLLGCWVEIR